MIQPVQRTDSAKRWLWAVAVWLAVALVAPAAAAGERSAEGGEVPVAVATDSRLAGDEARTRFIIDVDRELDFRVFALADPYRVVIDLPQTEFRFDEGTGSDGRGLVSAYRYGLFASGKSRVVLDASGPVEIDRAFALEPVDGQPARLVVDLVSTDRETMLAAIAENGVPPVPQARSEPGVDEHAAVPPGAGVEGQEVVVVIDAGHGGIDSGAVSRSGTAEKDVVLEFSMRLRDALESAGEFDVHLTREHDIFLPLADRVRFARERRASLFISVHADSVSAGSVRGASVYTLSERASDDVAAALAEQENRSDAIAGLDLAEEQDDVAGILIDLVRRETKNYSVFFARTLVDKLRQDIALVRNPHRSAGFRVLRAHDVPSVLLELGFLTSRSDEKLLTDAEWQEQAAGRVAEAVASYFGERQAHGPF